MEFRKGDWVEVRDSGSVVHSDSGLKAVIYSSISDDIHLCNDEYAYAGIEHYYLAVVDTRSAYVREQLKVNGRLHYLAIHGPYFSEELISITPPDFVNSFKYSPEDPVCRMLS